MQKRDKKYISFFMKPLTNGLIMCYNLNDKGVAVKKQLVNSVILILCHYRAKQSDGTFYENKAEDLASCILFATQDKKLAERKFKEIVNNEKTKSWVANYSSYNLPEYIVQFEDKDEFYCLNEQTNEFTHIQLVRSLLSNEE